MNEKQPKGERREQPVRIEFACGCRADPLGTDGVAWSLDHCKGHYAHDSEELRAEARDLRIEVRRLEDKVKELCQTIDELSHEAMDRDALADELAEALNISPGWPHERSKACDIGTCVGCEVRATKEAALARHAEMKQGGKDEVTDEGRR